MLFWALYLSVSNTQGNQQRECAEKDASCVDGHPYRGNGEHKNLSLGLQTKTTNVFLNRVQSWKPSSFPAMDCNTNVATCFTVQNLACLDCLHWFVVVVAIVFPVTTPSDYNKCAEWFTDSVTDDASSPFPNPIGIGSSDDVRGPNNKLGQWTLPRKRPGKLAQVWGGDSQTCKEP